MDSSAGQVRTRKEGSKRRLSLGCGALVLLLVVGCPVAIYNGAFCLFVPCDRPLTFQVEVAGAPPGEGCELWLFYDKPGDGSPPDRKEQIEEGKAEIITGPWTDEFWGSLHCPGRRPSPVQRIHFERREQTVPVRFAPLQPDAPPGAPGR